MSINSTLCHPEAESLVSLAAADAYLARHPDGAAWLSLGDGEEEVRTLLAEGLLAAASRMICRSPLRFAPLAKALGWAESALAIPLAGHPVYFGSADSFTEAGFVGTGLIGIAKGRVIGGAVRLDDDRIYSVTDFSPETGTVALADDAESVRPGEAYALVEALPPPVVYAVCEQAAYLALRPNLSVLNRSRQGVLSIASTGSGGGTVKMDDAPETGELCFAARRLLTSAGFLQIGRSLRAGRA